VNDTLPLAPLWRWLERRHTPSDAWGAHPFGRGAVAAACGVTVRVVRRWAASGLSVVEADRAAVALGQHPGDVWAEWWALGDESEVA
jgi:hypothetical protein